MRCCPPPLLQLLPLPLPLPLPLLLCPAVPAQRVLLTRAPRELGPMLSGGGGEGERASSATPPPCVMLPLPPLLLQALSIWWARCTSSC